MRNAIHGKQPVQGRPGRPAGPPVPVRGELSRPLPIRLDPTVEGGQRLIQRPAQVEQLVQRGGLDVLAVEVPGDQTVTLGLPQRVGQDLGGDAVEAVVEVLVAEALVEQLSESGRARRLASKRTKSSAGRGWPPVIAVARKVSCLTCSTVPEWATCVLRVVRATSRQRRRSGWRRRGRHPRRGRG